ncbi:TonB family protein [Bacteroides sp. 519]|uniref:M56 family metallopeptidase n=1 Tax=Bacteroides sp. 519 TaxID=2302937 RepID=UPI0013D01176|nr:M56 family metallopeptidase [Bacteroides sp. 519]NDV59745.1 M56 family peptidase [Bacteroides sp. 519]
METLILYLLKVNIAFVVLYLLYKLLFGKDTFLRLKRYVLLLICIVSVLYPFIEFELAYDQNNATITALSSLYDGLLPEVTISTEETDAPIFNWYHALGILYIIGIVLLSTRSLLEIRKITRKIFQSNKTVINGIKVCTFKERTEPYSFFNWICVSPDLYSCEELYEILHHEQTHAKERHSLDVLFIQLIIIFNWFNPFVWLLRNEMRINHEYLADRQVINSGYNKKSYQYHLIGLKQTSHLPVALYNSFSILPLKSRLKMLNRKATPAFMVYKYLLFIPFIAFLLIFSNCQNYMEQNKEEELIPVEKVEDTIFEIVEKMPEYPGGQTALMRYLNSSIKYPLAAQEKGIQGRVIVQFVVSKSGVITNPVVVRSVEESLDKEAIRVISGMPAWIPGEQRGKPVQVKYTVPITFRLQ